VEFITIVGYKGNVFGLFSGHGGRKPKLYRGIIVPAVVPVLLCLLVSYIKTAGKKYLRCGIDEVGSIVAGWIVWREGVKVGLVVET
jgi:hypothetical protein